VIDAAEAVRLVTISESAIESEVILKELIYD
jgi:hypothetical protein